ncbi:MAG TPA: hypothetical protein VNA69_14215 [Thermoanaerobaculia bacterium]|nr:hypothetical protein [Thermoanaerobaculia bacterium]
MKRLGFFLGTAADGKRKKVKGKSAKPLDEDRAGLREPLLPFTFYLLPFTPESTNGAFRLRSWYIGLDRCGQLVGFKEAK